jgi:hypothetical protein
MLNCRLYISSCTAQTQNGHNTGYIIMDINKNLRDQLEGYLTTVRLTQSLNEQVEYDTICDIDDEIFEPLEDILEFGLNDYIYEHLLDTDHARD